MKNEINGKIDEIALDVFKQINEFEDLFQEGCRINRTSVDKLLIAQEKLGNLLFDLTNDRIQGYTKQVVWNY